MNREDEYYMQRGAACGSLGSLIRRKFKTGNHLIMVGGRLVLNPGKSYYITVTSKINANINMWKVFSETQNDTFDSIIYRVHLQLII